MAACNYTYRVVLIMKNNIKYKIIKLPEDIPWRESANPELEFDPFVYDGTMTIEDFKKVQEKTLIELKNTD